MTEASVRVVTLNCTSCGAALEIGPDMVQLACGYCGATLAVERRGGAVAFKAVAAAIGRVQIGTDKTAAELAIARLGRELAAARAAWNAGDAKIARENPQGIIMFLGLVCAFSFVSVFVAGIVALGAATGEAGNHTGFIIGAALVAIGSGAAMKTMRSNHRKQREELWKAHGPRIAALEAQITKHRAVVEG